MRQTSIILRYLKVSEADKGQEKDKEIYCINLQLYIQLNNITFQQEEPFANKH